MEVMVQVHISHEQLHKFINTRPEGHAYRAVRDIRDAAVAAVTYVGAKRIPDVLAIDHDGITTYQQGYNIPIK